MAAAIRLRLLDVPLDRDEGEYAYFGQLLLVGVPPYAAGLQLQAAGNLRRLRLDPGRLRPNARGDPYRPHPDDLGHHGGHVSARRPTRRVGPGRRRRRRLRGPVVEPKMLGIAAYAEHFALLPVVAGAVVLWRGGRERRPISLLTCGILFGLGLLIRQSAALFVIGAVAYLLVARGDGIAEHPRVGRLGAIAVFLAGAAAPLALTCSGALGGRDFPNLLVLGVLVRALLPGRPGNGLEQPRPHARRGGAVHVGGAGPRRRRPGFGHPRPESRPADLRRRVDRVRGPGKNDGSAVQAPLLLTGRSSPGRALRYRTGRARRPARHPAVPRAPLGLPCTLGLVALAQPLYASRAVLFELGPGQVSRAIYGRNPFPESVEVACYIREHSAAADRVAVVGSEPQIYFYSAGRSATGYIYTYPLMELQPYAPAMQQEMIKEIEAAAPRFLVFVSATSSWIARPGSDRTIFGWFETYQRGFTRVGVVDIPRQQETVYRWGDAAAVYAPRSDVWLIVFERTRPQ